MALPPLKYCTIQRAARLLNCEMWDIFHWWQRGYIDLNIMVDSIEIVFLFRFNNKQYLRSCLNSQKESIKMKKGLPYDVKKIMYMMNEEKTFLCSTEQIYKGGKNIATLFPNYIQMNHSFIGTGMASGLLTLATRIKFPIFHEYLDFSLFDINTEVLFIPANFNDENRQLFINLEFETDVLRQIHISNLIILEEDLTYLQNFDGSVPIKDINYPNINLTTSLPKAGQKSHHLKDETILIAKNTKNYYLDRNIDLGLKAIAIKIKNHESYVNKGLPSPEQMARWFISAGIEASKTTKTFDFDLIVNTNY